MKIGKKQKGKKKAIIFIVVFLLILIGGGWFLYSQQNNNSEKLGSVEKNYVKKQDKNKTIEQIESEEPVAQSEAPQTEEKIIRSSTNSEGNPEKPNITRAEQVGDFIRVSALLNKPSNGKCLLKLEKAGSATLSKEAFVIVGPSYYACNGFRVSKNELGSSGSWTATVTHQANGKTTTSERRTINVE